LLKASLPSSAGAAGIPTVNLTNPAQAAKVVTKIRIGRLIENLADPVPGVIEPATFKTRGLPDLFRRDYLAQDR
jgi:hypothetical protein